MRYALKLTPLIFTKAEVSNFCPISVTKGIVWKPVSATE